MTELLLDWSEQDLNVIREDIRQSCTLVETQQHLRHKYSLSDIAKKKLEILHGNLQTIQKKVNNSDNQSAVTSASTEVNSNDKLYTLADLAKYVYPEKKDLFTASESLRHSGANKYIVKLKNILDMFGIPCSKGIKQRISNKGATRPSRVNLYKLTDDQLRRIKEKAQQGALYTSEKGVAPDGIKYVSPAEYELMKAEIKSNEDYAFMTIKEMYKLLYDNTELSSSDTMYIRLKHILFKSVNSELPTVAYVLKEDNNYTSPSKAYKITFTELDKLGQELKKRALSDSEIPFLYRHISKSTSVDSSEAKVSETQTTQQSDTVYAGYIPKSVKEDAPVSNPATECEKEVAENTVPETFYTECSCNKEEKKSDINVWISLAFATLLMYALTCSVMLIAKL